MVNPPYCSNSTTQFETKVFSLQTEIMFMAGNNVDEKNTVQSRCQKNQKRKLKGAKMHNLA